MAPMIYETMLLCALHMIHDMHVTFPNTPVLQCKFYLKDANRRLHMITRIATKFICAATAYAFIYLRLIFGGSFSPA